MSVTNKIYAYNHNPPTKNLFPFFPWLRDFKHFAANIIFADA